VYYVYLLIDPTTSQPFYCGKGKGDRWKSHLGYWSNNGKNNRCENKIKSLRAKGIEPEVKFLAENILDENLAYKIEEDYIREHLNNLVNLKIEARPPSRKGSSSWNRGCSMSKEFSDRQSTRLKEEYSTGKRCSWSNKLSKEEKHAFFSKMALSKKDFTSKRKTPIYCNELSKVYESQTAAAVELGLKQGDIGNVLKGRQKSTKGLTFKYV
jgi:asparagine synthetase B (glutamine-hydrolysing)